MKKIFIAMAAALVCMGAAAQDLTEAQQAAQDAAEAIEAAPEVVPAKPKFSSFWTESLKTDITFGQTALSNWAAGGDNTFSLAAHIDGQANMAKDAHFWNNRLQLDYGFLWASSKPITQKNLDRIYLESKWGYKIKDKLYFSANYDFKTQFTKGYSYNTPATRYADRIGSDGQPVLDADNNPIQDVVTPTRQEWRDARVPLSNFLSPAYTNLALGIDWKAAKWISINFAPLTGSYTIVKDEQFRKAYGMDLKKEYKDIESGYSPEQQAAVDSGAAYRAARFAFGAQLKIDASVNVNDNFAYSTQLVLFEDYLKDHKAHPCPRINWDNRISWKMAKYFALTLTTNMIYDDYVLIKNVNDKDYNDPGYEGHTRLQIMESLSFGFTYTIASKK